MLEKIQTYQQKWESEGHEYLLEHSMDDVKAFEESLEDWVRETSLKVWYYMTKREGIDFVIEDIEDALADAVEDGGDLKDAVEKLLEERAQQPFSETLTNSQRNPSLTRMFHE